VTTDVGRVALQRGPIVYCLEGVDNNGSVRDLALPREALLEAHFDRELLGGVALVRGRGLRRGAVEWDGALYRPVAPDHRLGVIAVPYYAWDNRRPGEMVVWVPESSALAEAKLPPTIAQAGEPAASFVHDDLRAVNDGVLPTRSNDQGIARSTWWDHKGTSEWVSLTFAQPQRLSCAEVYWFDDTGTGSCRVPQSWRIEWLDGAEWRPVTGASAYGVARDTLNRVGFDPVTTTVIRLVVQLQSEFSGGVLEWRLPQ
jgi:hypothetical protein